MTAGSTWSFSVSSWFHADVVTHVPSSNGLALFCAAVSKQTQLPGSEAPLRGSIDAHPSTPAAAAAAAPPVDEASRAQQLPMLFPIGQLGLAGLGRAHGSRGAKRRDPTTLADSTAALRAKSMSW